MNRSALLLVALPLLAACTAAPVAPEPVTPPLPAPTQALSTASTPAERYWQALFLAGVTDDIDDTLFALLENRYGPPDGTVPTVPELAAFQGAGYRVASAESILDATTDLASLRRAADGELLAEIERLERTEAAAISTVDREILAEEILIVRSAVLDSLETLQTEGAGLSDQQLERYREGTLRARNTLELIGFSGEMDRLTARSIEESSGRLDAFHRLMDDSSDTAFLRERILATEEMNRQLTDEHREYAARRTMRTLFFLLPALNSYFRYR